MRRSGPDQMRRNCPVHNPEHPPKASYREIDLGRLFSGSQGQTSQTSRIASRFHIQQTMAREVAAGS